MAAAAAGRSADRMVLAADHQTAGRGRLDRRWDAPPGANLLVSMLFTPVPAVPASLTQRVAVAAAQTAERLVPGVRIDLKWPNDLLVGDGKVGGILAERSGDVVVVGLGFNIGWSPPGAADLGGAVAPARFLARLLATIDALPGDVGPLHRDRLVTIGRAIRADLPGGASLTGTAVDVDDDGRLVVLDDAGRHRILDVADVVHVRAG